MDPTGLYTCRLAGTTKVQCMDILDTIHCRSLLLDLFDGVSTIECLVNLLEGSAASLDEEEVDDDELDDEPAFEEEVELPATSVDTDRDEVLREEEADVSGDVLHKQAVGTNLETENLEGVGDVEGNPGQG